MQNAEGCGETPHDDSIHCIQLVAVMEQSSAPRALDLNEVTAATEEHACVFGMVCMVVSSLQDGAGASDAVEASASCCDECFRDMG